VIYYSAILKKGIYIAGNHSYVFIGPVGKEPILT